MALVESVFGKAIDTSIVRLRRRRWFPLQPRSVVMAPCGHVHFHPRSPNYCDDFARADLGLQGLFIHEMTHVWQAQKRGPWYLPLCRPFSWRYDYELKPGWPLESYGIEQQAEIVRHAFLLRNGAEFCPQAYEFAAFNAEFYVRLHLRRGRRIQVAGEKIRQLHFCPFAIHDAFLPVISKKISRSACMARNTRTLTAPTSQSSNSAICSYFIP